MIVAHVGEVRVLIRFESEAILRLPQIALATLENQVLSVRSNDKRRCLAACSFR